MKQQIIDLLKELLAAAIHNKGFWKILEKLLDLLDQLPDDDIDLTLLALLQALCDKLHEKGMPSRDSLPILWERIVKLCGGRLPDLEKRLKRTPPKRKI